MKKHLSLLLAGGLVFAASAAIAQDGAPVPPVPPTPPVPPPAHADVWGGVVRAGSYLGVMLGDVDDASRTRLNLGDASGALVTQVSPGSPAEKAGLHVGDVVVAVDGTEIKDPMDLSRRVRRTPVGTAMKLEVLRDGQRVALEATVGERTVELPRSLGIAIDSLNDHFTILRGRMDSLRIAVGDDAAALERELGIGGHGGHGAIAFIGGRGRLGAEMQPLTAQLAKYFGVQGRRGALVGSVADSGAAHAAGLQAGDVIVAVDGQAISSPGDVARAVAAKDAGPLELTIVRDRHEQTLRVELPKKGASFGAGFGFDGEGMRFFGDGAEMKIFSDSDGVRLLNGGRELRLDGNGAEITIRRRGDGTADTTIRLLDPKMFPELKELENLPNMPEMRELERLPEMIREEMRRREIEMDEATDADAPEADAPQTDAPKSEAPAAEEFGNLPDGDADSRK